MRYLFTTLPGLGHFHPSAPIAKALQLRGHDVLYATAPSFCVAIERTGLKAVGCGIDWSVAGPERTFEQFKDVDVADQTDLWQNDIVTGEPPRAMFLELIELARDWKPDVVVWEFYEQAGPLVAEALDVPHALVGDLMYVPSEVLSSYLGEGIEKLRKDVGLPADPGLDSIYRHLYLDFLPSGFHAWDPEEMPTAHRVRLAEFDQDVTDQLPEWAAKTSSPLVYATLGTTFNRNNSLHRMLIEALADQGFDVLLTVGPNQDPTSFGPTAENVHVEQYAPHSLVYPRANLAITHGAFHTVLAGLYHGVPQLVLPQMADQAINAQRCAELGAGISMLTDDVAVEPMREAVRDLLERASYREASDRLRREVDAMAPMEEAADLLEALARSRRPVVRAAIGDAVGRPAEPQERKRPAFGLPNKLLPGRWPPWRNRRHGRSATGTRHEIRTPGDVRTQADLAQLIKGKTDAEIRADVIDHGTRQVLTEAFTGMVARFDPGRAGKHTARVNWLINTQDGPVSYWLEIAGETCRSGVGELETPDLALRMEVATFIRVLAGGSKAGLRAFIAGKLRLSGDMKLGAILERWFPDEEPRT